MVIPCFLSRYGVISAFSHCILFGLRTHGVQRLQADITPYPGKKQQITMSIGLLGKGQDRGWAHIQFMLQQHPVDNTHAEYSSIVPVWIEYPFCLGQVPKLTAPARSSTSMLRGLTRVGMQHDLIHTEISRESPGVHLSSCNQPNKSHTLTLHTGC